MRRPSLRLAFTLALFLAPTACGEDPGGSAADAVGTDTLAADTAVADTTSAPDGDAGLTDTVAPSDTEPTADTATGADTVAPTDTVVGDTTGPVVPVCGEVTFNYTPGGNPSQVLLTGTFSGWAAAAPAATVMADPEGDGTFTATLVLDPGSYQYKYIVDGNWVADPAMPLVDDTFGGHNNALEVPECTGLTLSSFAVDSAAGSFEARFVSASGTVDPGAVSVTVDGQPAPAGSVTASAGGGVRVGGSGLPRGIHDVRVTFAGTTRLLKVYVGVSTDWRDALLYFVMTDRFVDGQAANNAPVAGVDVRVNYQGGDFAGVTQKIQSGYFDDLGVGALWLSWPVDNAEGYADGGYPDHHACGLDAKTTGQLPMRFTAYHGYWPSQTDQIEAHFGTLAELQTLVNAAHARGIRIVLDFTANHVHASSPVYTQHQNDGWFNTPAQLCQDVGWDTLPKTCWFTSYLPDLNYNNADARAYMVDHAVDIILATGADGFRLDAVKHIELSFVTALRARLRDEVELTGVPFYLVGETFSGDVGLIDGFVGADKLHGQFDFPANLQLLKGFAKQEIGLSAMDGAIRTARAGYKDGGALMSTFIGNHDIARFTSVAAGDIYCGIWDVYSDIAQGWHYPPGTPSDAAAYQKLRLALTYALTVPGVPLIYYGDEFGMPGAGDPDNRRMMRFGGALAANEAATLAAIQALGKARAAHPSLSRGTLTAALASEADLLAYGRTLPSEKAIIVLNRGASARSVNLAVGAVGVPSGATLQDVLGGPSVTASGTNLTVDVPARSARVLVVATP